MKISAISRLACKSSRVKVSVKRPREKYILEAEESSARLHFGSTLQDRPSCKIPVKLSTWRILSVTFLPFTHTIYTLITHKSKGGYWDKTLERFLQHTHLLERERTTHHLVRNPCSLFSFPPPIVIPWKEICIQTQPTPIQSVESVLELGKHLGFAKRSQWGLVDAIGWCYGIWKASEDKNLRSLLVAGPWRA